ncbi:TetR family transcriptional regulator [Williamsia limnetica]|jgi:AcrR family transcriptional regulator|uniref:TetR family transcriptional regulator n=1 Tax=Williamsia limnetica TaxID=882452 RepID=A0A318RPH6_WILLI|nr:TetR/AcrR family transcriptional regulator [Williamsia limnetica]PYE18712.1 TetR family transcriptional regulator [Williamsia limnetica]
MSIRNDSPAALRSRDPETRDVTDRVLDAARSALVRAGGGKITLAEVARTAGVSRPTVYRRWPDVGSVTGELVTREMAGLVAGIPATGPTLDEQVDRLVAVADAIRENELFSVLWREPSTALAPYVFVRLGKSQKAVLALLQRAIVDGQRRGDVRTGKPDQLAAMVLLICQSAIQSHAIVEPILGEQWSVELRHALMSYLRIER